MNVSDNGQAAVGGAGGGSAGPSMTCSYLEIGERLPDGRLPEFLALPGAALTPDFYYLASCTSGGAVVLSSVFRHQPGVPSIDPATLARHASNLLRPTAPTVHTSPEAPVDQLVGLDTWLWTDPQSFEPRTATAAIPGLSVTATATPTGITWDMGDGTRPVECDGPGTAYDPDVPIERQHTDCSHLYQSRGVYAATATIAYRVTWTATNGAGGTLQTTNRTTSFTMRVAEFQVTGVN